MASLFVFKSWQFCNKCYEFTLRYHLPIYMDPKTKTLPLKNISKTLVLLVALVQTFDCLMMLFVIEPKFLHSVSIGVELKIKLHNLLLY